MIDRGKVNILGVNLSAVDYEAAVAQIIDAATQRRPLGVSALAVHGVMTGVMDPAHRHRLNALELVVPDGQPVRWAMNRLHGTGLADRVYGPNLMLKCCAAADENGLPIFLFGGTAQLLQSLQKRLQQQFPTLQIAGTQPSKFRTISPAEKQELIDTIRTSGAAITMVGLGCPRQEVWAYEFKDSLQMPVLAVGAAFNFHAGELAQAPETMQRLGLEWLYRLSREPRRLWQRYLFLNPYYVSLLTLQALKLRRFDPQATTPPAGEVLYG